MFLLDSLQIYTSIYASVPRWQVVKRDTWRLSYQSVKSFTTLIWAALALKSPAKKHRTTHDCICNWNKSSKALITTLAREIIREHCITFRRYELFGVSVAKYLSSFTSTAEKVDPSFEVCHILTLTALAGRVYCCKTANCDPVNWQPPWIEIITISTDDWAL